MATIALPSVGGSRTLSTGLSRRTARWAAMIAQRFSLWHRVEPPIDVWASAAALAVAALSTGALFAL